MRFHLPAPALQVAFVYFWLDLLALLDAHLSQPKFIPFRAMFTLLRQVRADRTAPIPPAMMTLAESIEHGCFLSRPFCELRNIAIALRANRADEVIAHALDFLKMPNPPPPALFAESISRHFLGQPLHLIKFEIANGRLTATATPLDFPIAPDPVVFPNYAMLVFQRRGGPGDAGDSVRTGDLTFEIGVRGFDKGEGDDGFGINFTPGTTSSFISLEEDVI
jgi:hypothetical protein